MPKYLLDLSELYKPHIDPLKAFCLTVHVDVAAQKNAGGWVRVEEPSAPHLPDGFRQGNEPMMSSLDGFRQGTKPEISVPDGFSQGNEPMMLIPDGFR